VAGLAGVGSRPLALVHRQLTRLSCLEASRRVRAGGERSEHARQCNRITVVAEAETAGTGWPQRHAGGGQAAAGQQDPGRTQMTAADAVTETISGAAGTMNP
jgi:hypothetical protein